MIFKSDKSENEFKRLLNSFSQSLYLLNINTYLLRKIIFFRFDLCGVRGDDKLFFFIVEKNIFEYSVIIIQRMLFDSNGWTLEKFRNSLFELIDLAALKTLSKEVKKLRDPKYNDLKDRVETLRHKFFAHSDFDVIEQSDNLYRLNFGELEYLVESINAYFDLLSDLTKIDYQKVPFPYLENSERVQIHHKQRNDIEKILDGHGFNSPFLTMQEDDPEEWQYYISKWSEMGTKQVNLDFLNYYRRQKKLPELNP